MPRREHAIYEEPVHHAARRPPKGHEVAEEPKVIIAEEEPVPESGKRKKTADVAAPSEATQDDAAHIAELEKQLGIHDETIEKTKTSQAKNRQKVKEFAEKRIEDTKTILGQSRAAALWEEAKAIFAAQKKNQDPGTMATDFVNNVAEVIQRHTDNPAEQKAAIEKLKKQYGSFGNLKSVDVFAEHTSTASEAPTTKESSVDTTPADIKKTIDILTQPVAAKMWDDVNAKFLEKNSDRKTVANLATDYVQNVADIVEKYKNDTAKRDAQISKLNDAFSHFGDVTFYKPLKDEPAELPTETIPGNVVELKKKIVIRKEKPRTVEAQPASETAPTHVETVDDNAQLKQTAQELLAQAENTNISRSDRTVLIGKISEARTALRERNKKNADKELTKLFLELGMTMRDLISSKTDESIMTDEENFETKFGIDPYKLRMEAYGDLDADTINTALNSPDYKAWLKQHEEETIPEAEAEENARERSMKEKIVKTIARGLEEEEKARDQQLMDSDTLRGTWTEQGERDERLNHEIIELGLEDTDFAETYLELSLLFNKRQKLAEEGKSTRDIEKRIAPVQKRYDDQYHELTKKKDKAVQEKIERKAKREAAKKTPEQIQQIAKDFVASKAQEQWEKKHPEEAQVEYQRLGEQRNNLLKLNEDLHSQVLELQARVPRNQAEIDRVNSLLVETENRLHELAQTFGEVPIPSEQIPTPLDRVKRWWKGLFKKAEPKYEQAEAPSAPEELSANEDARREDLQESIDKQEEADERTRIEQRISKENLRDVPHAVELYKIVLKASENDDTTADDMIEKAAKYLRAAKGGMEPLMKSFETELEWLNVQNEPLVEELVKNAHELMQAKRNETKKRIEEGKQRRKAS